MDRNSDSAARDPLRQSEALGKSSQALQESIARLAEKMHQLQEQANAPGNPVATQAKPDSQPAAAPAASAIAPQTVQSTQIDIPASSAKKFYDQLEQQGQLVDVDENTDLSKLSSRITHIRHRDGTVERIGFS